MDGQNTAAERSTTILDGKLRPKAPQMKYTSTFPLYNNIIIYTYSKSSLPSFIFIVYLFGYNTQASLTAGHE